MTQIFSLSEGEFTVGHDKQIIPFDPASDQLPDRATGSLLIEIQPFLVVTDKGLILLDTGLGLKNAGGELQIHSNLRQSGYQPEAVTKVFHSHLHKDHCGGMVFKDDRGILHPTFPNADYYLYRPEVDYALQTGYPSYNKKEIEDALPVIQVKWLDGENGLIDGYIRFEHTGAHCPQHIVFIIDDGVDKLFYGGDEAPQLKQMLMRYVAKYDYDGKKAMTIREKYAAMGKKEGWKFLFYHDVKSAVAKL